MNSQESTIKQLCEVSDYHTAVSLIIQAHRTELLKFLWSRLHNEANMHEVFSGFSEDLLVGLASFRWQCSLRAWLYTVLRHAAARFVRAPAQRASRNLELSDHPIAAGARTETARFQKTEVKSRFRLLRRQLSEDDQLVLQLRIDHELGWEEISCVTLGEPAAARAEIARESARLRKRFQLIKARLRELARAEGLLDESSDS